MNYNTQNLWDSIICIINMFVQKFVFKQAQAIKFKRLSIFSSKLFTPSLLRTFGANVRGFQQQDVFGVIDSLRNGKDVAKNSEVIDEYFRVNFRRMDFDTAWKFLKSLHDIYDLEDKFWVWETLEEAIRPSIFEIPDAKFNEIHDHFLSLHKGSRYFWYDVEDRLTGRVKVF